MEANDMAAMREAMREALGKVNEIYDILSKPCIVIEDARQACREARAVLIPAIDKPPRQCDVGTADNAKSRPEAIVNAIKPFDVHGDTEVKSAYDLIALVQRAIGDIQVETRGNFNPRKHAFTISVIASFAHLLNERLCGRCTARDWLIREYGLCTIGIIADTPEYIVKVKVFMNDFLREFEARRKNFATDTNGKGVSERRETERI